MLQTDEHPGTKIKNEDLAFCFPCGTSCYDLPGMNGQLSEHPLTELISEILEKRLSGALRVDRQRVKAVIYFEAGELLYATANLRSLRLAGYLKKRGIPAEIASATNSSSDSDLAAALTSRRLITPTLLDSIIAEQVFDVVRVLLLWTRGDWNFDERARLTGPVRARLPVKQLLLDAARRMDREVVSRRFRSPAETIAPALDAATDLNLSSTEGFLLSRVEAPIALAELLNISGLPEADAYRTIYGLLLAGILQRESGASAFRAPIENQKAPATKTAVPAPSAANPEAAPPRDPQEELKDFLDQLAQATNHYEVLNVPTSADAGDVKLAYYSLARRFHPDRFHGLVQTPLHAQIEAAFARITQAHEALSDPDSRSAYDVKISALSRAGKLSPTLARPSRSADFQVESATNEAGDMALTEQRFKEGVIALQLGQTNTAIASLSAAARLAPNQARYRAYYGRALASHQQSRRLAEAELKAAVRLEPENAEYHVLLAGLYRDLGFSRRAITQLERALSLDAKNVEARRMLESLEVRK
ncbi:MAG: DnaJ domain-containing protein [Acidobacteriota bacterium]|nr:DnaJ domain-containing protein [Acidobacteriota bacterium]